MTFPKCSVLLGMPSGAPKQIGQTRSRRAIGCGARWGILPTRAIAQRYIPGTKRYTKVHEGTPKGPSPGASLEASKTTICPFFGEYRGGCYPLCTDPSFAQGVGNITHFRIRADPDAILYDPWRCCRSPIWAHRSATRRILDGSFNLTLVRARRSGWSGETACGKSDPHEDHRGARRVKPRQRPAPVARGARAVT